MTKHNVRCSSIALVKDERLVYTLGYGSESTSLFRIASVSKPITSAVVMMMIEERLGFSRGVITLRQFYLKLKNLKS